MGELPEETDGLQRYLQLKISDLLGQVSALQTLLEERVEQLQTKISTDSSKIAEQLLESAKCPEEHSEGPPKPGESS